jgi:hypothetical protein
MKSGTVLAPDVIVGGAVSQGAVVTVQNNLPNADDELGATPVATAVTAQQPGNIDAPQLHSATFTSTTGSAVDTFDESLACASAGCSTLAPGLHWYDADGTQLTCAANAATIGTTTADDTVTCTSFIQNGGSAATAAQMSAVVLATVDVGAVAGNPAGTAAPASNNFQNPEGAAAA